MKTTRVYLGVCVFILFPEGQNVRCSDSLTNINALMSHYLTKEGL